MKSDHKAKQTKQDKLWQEKIDKKVAAEKLSLGHTKGKERFDKAINNSLKIKSK